MHFWSIKGVYFLQNANNLNFKLFLRLYRWPTKQVICLNLRRILDNELFWMSLKSTFLAFKKVVQVVQIRGRRVIWTKYNRRATFFCDTFFNGSIAPFNPLEHFGLFSFCRRIILLQTFSENNFYFATTSCQYNGPKSTHFLFLSSFRYFR